MESVGGYRIVRRLGSGGRSDVYLGHAGHAPEGEPRLAAIKVFKAHATEESIGAEVAALSRLRHAHITQLLDLATGPRNTPCLILQRLEPGGLPQLLAGRRELEPGEAVTILAPIVAAVAAMHRVGVVHGRLRAQTVLFAASGAPVLSGFGGAGSFSDPGGPPVTAALLDDDPGVRADRQALAALVVSVLGHVRGATRPSVEVTDWLGEETGGTEALAALEHRLFALASPLAVNFTPSITDYAVPSRLNPAERTALTTQPTGAVEAGLFDSGWFGRFALPPEVANWLAKLWAHAPDGLVSRMAALPSAVRSVRRGVWLVAGIGLVAIVAAFVVTQLPAAQSDSGVSRGIETVSPSSAPAPSSTLAPAVQEDPIAAATALLELRAQCLRDRSILCLDTVHAPGSAAWKADASRIQLIQGGGEATPDRLDPSGMITLLDRMGDTALLSVTPSQADAPDNATASILLIRTEAGWRFRSLLAGSASVD